MNLIWVNQKTDIDDSGLGVTIDWINAFANNVNKIYVITHDAGRLPDIPNVEIVSIGKEKGYSKVRKAWELYRHCWRIIQNNKIDGCFVHMVPIFGVMLSPLLRLKGIPILQWYTHGYTSWAARLSYYLANQILTASHESLSITGSKILAIGHGIDTDHFSPASVEKKDGQPVKRIRKIITVGRISPVKRLEVLISAVKELRQQEIACELSIIGEPRGSEGESFLAALKQQVRQNKLEQFVHFIGTVPRYELPNWYQNADLFVNLSNLGGMDKAVMEAVCCHTPILTSNRSYEPMLKEIAPSAFLPKNDPKKIVNGMKYWFERSEQEKNDIIKKARLWVENNHGLTAFVDKVLTIFKRLS